MDSRDIQRTYRWMAPAYDFLFQRFYRRLRRASIDGAELLHTERVVLVGAGTGLDISLLPPVARLVVVDLSRPMLLRATKKRGRTPPDFVFADGARLPLKESTMTVVVFHLVLSVAPEPRAMLAEAGRILEAGGRVAILDHFAPQGRIGLVRRVLSRVPRLVGTHFDRRFEEMIEGLPFEIRSDRRFLGGLYRVLTLDYVGDITSDEGPGAETSP